VDTRLADVQKRLLKLVKPSDILIGHSLENDFKACKFIHKRVIDTSVLYPHQKGGPYKNALRYLVSKFLGREMDRKDGHCSADDAQAVMDLVQCNSCTIHRPPFAVYFSSLIHLKTSPVDPHIQNLHMMILTTKPSTR
jgi:DNA polymerase III epsilon subunit-like protein